MKGACCRILFFALLLSSCASSGLNDRAGLRELIRQYRYDDAIKYIESNTFFNKPQNKYLKNLELGMAYHLKGIPSLAIHHLNIAKEIDDRMFTISISNQLKTAVTNDLSKNYQGDIYERSSMYFFLAMNRAILGQSDESIFADANEESGFKNRRLTRDEKSQYLYAARATVVQWDGFMENVRRQAKKEVFQHDLLAKVGGGFIHEMIGTRNDRQTAVYLYQQALKILPSFYAPFESMNILSKEFKKSIFNGERRDSLVSLTDEAKSLEKFLLMKISHLKKSKNKTHNMMVIWEEGIIGEKKPKREYYSLARALSGPNSTPDQQRAAKMGARLITLFASSALGLLPPPNYYSPAGAEFGVRLGLAAATELAISFDVPMMEKVDPPFPAEVSFHKEDGSEVLRTPLHLVNPVNEIASASTSFHSARRALVLGSRLAWKHIIAITAALATYRSMKKSNAEFVAKQMALFQYIASAKLIAESETADTRYWSTLPKNLRFSHVYLPPGKYQIKVHEISSTGGTSEFGPINITRNQKKIFRVRL